MTDGASKRKNGRGTLRSRCACGGIEYGLDDGALRSMAVPELGAAGTGRRDGRRPKQTKWTLEGYPDRNK